MKKTYYYLKTIAITACLMTNTKDLNAQNITLKIKGIKSYGGQILVNVFDSYINFTQAKGIAQYKFSKSTLRKDSLTLHFTLKPGLYGIVLIDDENSNARTDVNSKGELNEGIGFSNITNPQMTAPAFKDFMFYVKTDTVMLQTKMKYRAQ